MTNDLMARAARESRKEKLRRYPRLSKDAGKLAAALGCSWTRSSTRSSCRWIWCGRISRARGSADRARAERGTSAKTCRRSRGTHQPRRSELPAPGELHGRQQHPDRCAGHDRAREAVGRRLGRRDRRDALRRPGPQHPRAAEPEVLRAPARRDLAEHAQRPGRRPHRPRAVGAPRATRCT